jgi:hypothetical protein
MDKKTFTLEFPFAVGKPTINGHIYPRDVMETAIANYGETMSERRAWGETGDGSDPVTLSKTSHLITGLRLEDDAIKGDVEVLPTKAGKVLAELHDAEWPLFLSPVGHGDVDPETGEVSSFKLSFINVSLVPAKAK